MKRRGFIFSPIILIGFCIVASCFMYTINLNKLDINMTLSSSDKIQSKYHTETKINRILYDVYYYDSYLEPFIINHLRNPLTSPKSLDIVLRSEDLDDEDISKLVKIMISDNKNNKEIKVETESKYKRTKVSSTKHFNIINSLFEVGNLPLISYDLDFDTCENLFEFYKGLENGLRLDIIPSNYKLINTFDHEKIIIKTKSSTKNIITKIRNTNSFTEEYDKLTNRDIVIIMKNNIFRPIELEIEEGNHSDPLTLNGIIYLEGDLIISGRFKFNGIIILKGSDSKIIVNSEMKPSIKGIILTEGEVDFIDSIDIKYEGDYIYKYGVYLPGFIDIKKTR